MRRVTELRNDPPGFGTHTNCASSDWDEKKIISEEGLAFRWSAFSLVPNLMDCCYPGFLIQILMNDKQRIESRTYTKLLVSILSVFLCFRLTPHAYRRVAEEKL
jgi:hypothetical protein